MESDQISRDLIVSLFDDEEQRLLIEKLVLSSDYEEIVSELISELDEGLEDD